MHFAPGQKVKVRAAVGELPAGTVGAVVGYYATSTPKYVVAFPDHRVLELLPELLELAPALTA